jgi:hypothetical protein
MTQQQINSTVWFILFFLSVGLLILSITANLQNKYNWETRNRLTQLEGQVNYQEKRISKTDHNLYHKVMTDTESELVKESLKLVEDTIGCDCMFYSFENYWVVFEYPQSVTGDSAYIYANIDTKVIIKDYKPRF